MAAEILLHADACQCRNASLTLAPTLFYNSPSLTTSSFAYVSQVLCYPRLLYTGSSIQPSLGHSELQLVLHNRHGLLSLQTYSGFLALERFSF